MGPPCSKTYRSCRGVYITDSVLVDLGIRSSCAIGNNELVVVVIIVDQFAFRPTVPLVALCVLLLSYFTM